MNCLFIKKTALFTRNVSKAAAVTSILDSAIVETFLDSFFDFRTSKIVETVLDSSKNFR